ncbi:MAG: PQQ-binding-like beta-propeller repeat protein [Nanoarchaeota archaeon]|nr:PQQ-binding-like beta-propeller repeat protein [Nanoarchaeota archaeon]
MEICLKWSVKGLIILFGKKRGRVFEKWSFNTNSSILASPAVSGNHVIVATMDGRILRLDSEGQVLWEYKVSSKIGKVEAMFLEKQELNAIYSSPSLYDINNDGVDEIIIGTDMGDVLVLSQDGALLWKYKAKGAVRGKIVFCNNMLFFGSVDGYFYALDINGKLLWKYNAESRIESTPGCSQNKILFGANNGVLFCLDFKGQLLWNFKTGASIVAEPVMAELFHNIFYIVVGSTDHNLYCLTLDGELSWVFETDGRIFSAVAVADINKDGELEIVFGSCDNSVYAIDNHGQLLWSYETDFWVVATPLVVDIDGDGKLEVVASSYDNTMYVLDGEGSYVLDYMPGLSGIVMQSGHYTNLLTSDPGELVGKKIWEYQTEGVITGNVLLNKNQVIIATKAGKLDDIAYTR